MSAARVADNLVVAGLRQLNLNLEFQHGRAANGGGVDA